MGAVITQDNKPVAYWSKKLSPTKKRYSTIEQELLAITELLKEYRNILLGQEIIIMTDHKNLTYANTAFSSNRLLRQRLTIEEFGPTIKHTQGEKNIAADTLSRFDFSPNKSVATTIANNLEEKHQHENLLLECLECYSNDSPPIDYQRIQDGQQKDRNLMELRTLPQTKKFFKKMQFGSIHLWTKKLRNNTQEQIYIPQDLRMELMDWYHEILMHPGQARMEESVLQYFTWPGCTSDIKKFVQQCKICQKNKSTNVGQVGKIPIKDPPEMEP